MNRLVQVLAIVFAAHGCTGRSDAPPTSAPPPPPSSVDARWVPLRPPEAVSFLELPAAVLAAAGTTALVNPPYAGQIVKLHVRPGDEVKRAQVVAEIVMPSVVAAVGEQASARTKIDAYLRRMAQLNALKAEGLVRSIEIADVEMRLAEARADEQRAGAVLRSAGVSASEGRRLAGGRGAVPLRSPIDGTVTEVSAALGETRDGAGGPLARIAGTANARIEARAVQTLPLDARFELVTAEGDKIPLRLVGESPAADPRDGTTAIWFEPNPPRPLRAGVTGKLRVTVPKRDGLTVAPRSAIGESGAGTYVRARKPTGPATVTVKVLLSSGADALIESALPAGTEIAEHLAEPGR